MPFGKMKVSFLLLLVFTEAEDTKDRSSSAHEIKTRGFRLVRDVKSINQIVLLLTLCYKTREFGRSAVTLTRSF